MRLGELEGLREGGQGRDGFPESYYRERCGEKIVRRAGPPEGLEVEVAVVGAGLTGLCTALALAERGHRVVVLESKRGGWAASGRNGGFALPGLTVGPEQLLEKWGEADARRVYQMTLAAADTLKRRISSHSIRCDLALGGSANVSPFSADAPATLAAVDRCNRLLGTRFEYWPPERCALLLPNSRYHHAVFDPDAFTVNPLALCLGLARAAESLGVLIFEDSAVQSILDLSPTCASFSLPETSPAPDMRRFCLSLKGGGSVISKEVVLAGSCHLDGQLERTVARCVTPVYSHVGVTKPLGKERMALLVAPEGPACVFDDLASVNYYRPLPDGRLLWGARLDCTTATEEFSEDLARQIRQRILHYYPALRDEDIDIEYTWGGDMAFGWSQLPLIGRRRTGLYYATGFGGHGVVPTTMAGEMIADAIHQGPDQPTSLDFYQSLAPPLPVGYPFDRVLGVVYMSLLTTVDSIRVHFGI